MSALEPIQLERLREIGALLQRERESKGMSLEDVSAKTLIRPSILKAIEEANATPLPEPVYLRGFIRRYGDLVDLPGVQLSDSFPWEPSQVVPAAFVAASVTTVESVDDTRRPASLPRAEARVIEPDPVLPDEPDLTEPTDALALPEPDREPMAEFGLEPPSDQWTESAAASTQAAAEQPGIETSPEFPAVSPDLTPEPAEAPFSRSLGGEAETPKDSIPENLILPTPAPVEGAVQPHLSLGTPPQAETSPPAVNENLFPTVQSSATEAQAGLEAQGTADPWSEAPPVAPLAPAPAPVEPLPMPRRPALDNVSPEPQSGLPGAMIALIFAAIALGVGVAFALSSRDRTPAVTDSPAQIESSEVETPAETVTPPPASGASGAPAAPAAPAAAETPSPSPEPPNQPATAANPSANADEVSVQLQLKESAWFYVQVDGLVVFEGIASEFPQAAQGKEVVIGTSRPDLLLVSVDGAAPKPMGTEAADTTETYTPGG